MECYTCGKTYTTWRGLFYHKGAVHGDTNNVYEQIKNGQRRSKLLRNLKENCVEEKANSSGCGVKRNLDVLSEENSGNDEFQFKSFITGYYHYCNIWTPEIGEELNTSSEIDNVNDEFAVSIIKDGNTIIGHAPWQIAKQFTALLKSGGSVVAKVTDDPVTMRKQGIRVPCDYIVCGIYTLVHDIKKNIVNIL